MTHVYMYLVIIFSIIRIYCTQNIEQNEYCVDESFNPQCHPGEMVLMQSAFYGRMSIGRCLPTDIGFMGCQSNVLAQLDQDCTGKTTCDVTVNDRRINPQGGCIKGLQSYLHAQHKCVQGLNVENGCTPNQPVEIEAIIGDFYLSDQHLKEACTRQGGAFTIKAKHGQVMNVSQVNLQHTISNDGIYGTLEDRVADKIIVLGEGPRDAHLLTSSSNEMALIVSESEYDGNRFLLHITVSGCPNMPPPDGAWMTRDGNIMEIGCHTGAKTWSLRCQENQWVGAIGQCGEVPSVVGDKQETGTNAQVSSELSINAMLFGICSLIILMSAIIFLFGVCLLKRKFQTPIYKQPLDQNAFPQLLPQEMMGQNFQTLPISTHDKMYPVHGLTMEPVYKSLRQSTMGRNLNAGNTEQESVPAYINTTGSDPSDSVKYYVLEDATKYQ